MLEIVELKNRPDLNTICTKWNFNEWGREAGFDEAHIADAFREIANAKDQTALVALWNGEPCGMVLLIHNDLQTHPHLRPWLASLYVEPEYRGKGIGQQLVKAVEQAAGNFGYHEAYLYTSQPKFYHNIGWVDFEALNDFSKPMFILRTSVSSAK